MARVVATVKPVIVKTADDARGTVRVSVIPTAFTMSSTIIWQAMQAAIDCWGWPVNISPEVFLDKYLYTSFKQRGITLGGYTVDVPRDGNGHRGNEELIEDVIGGIEDEYSQ